MADFQVIDEIINAGSLAIVGASSRPLKFGSMFLESLLKMGYKGKIYPINAKEKEIMGLPAYASISELPEIPELVYITIPAYQCMEVLRECMGKGVKGVIIIAAGFREVGERGAKLEEEAIRMAREGGFRIIGPNCFGIYNPRTRITLPPGPDFSSRPGKVAFISQSGGFGAHMARMGKGMRIDFSAIVSYGNGADLSEAELIEYFTEDEQTRIISGYIEGTRDGRALYRALRKAAGKKPVILWKVGKRPAGQRAALSHTGSLAGSDRIWQSLFEQCGVMAVENLDELMGVVQCFYHLEDRPVRNLLVMGGGGGLGAQAADLAEESGLSLPPLSPETEARLREFFPDVGAVVANPLDVGIPLPPPPLFKLALDHLLVDPAFDLLIYDLAINFGVRLFGEEGVREAFRYLVSACRKMGKPCAVNLYNRAPDSLEITRLHLEVKEMLYEAGIPVYDNMALLMRSLAALSRWQQARG